MKFQILAPNLIGGLYLIILFILCTAICVFVKLCVFYYKITVTKPPQPKQEPKKSLTIKKPTKPRTPVRKIIINPNEVNRIYVKTEEKAK